MFCSSFEDLLTFHKIRPQTHKTNKKHSTSYRFICPFIAKKTHQIKNVYQQKKYLGTIPFSAIRRQLPIRMVHV